MKKILIFNILTDLIPSMSSSIQNYVFESSQRRDLMVYYVFSDSTYRAPGSKNSDEYKDTYEHISSDSELMEK